jgi:transcriptional antiterminator NusG
VVEGRKSESVEESPESVPVEAAVDVGASVSEPQGETVVDSPANGTVEEGDAGAESSVSAEGLSDASEQDPDVEQAEIKVEESGDAPAVKPLELVEESEESQSEDKNWYILKVQVNREKSICDALARRLKVAGLDDYFGEILIPTEDVREFTKTGKQRIIKRKLYPGYILVNMAINDDTWFLVRETPGIGDFTGAAGKPTPMEPFEVDRILKTMRPDEEESSPEKTNIRFKQGDRVRVKEGYFQNFEGEVESIDEANGRITVMINIFGRPTPVELDHWQFEDV